MCGIFGCLTPRQVHIDCNILPHRGPDDWGVQYNDFPAGALTLFQSRLSIIGLGEQGHQPFAKYRRYLLAYNGEIYNYRDIRGNLETECRVNFETGTDTEVLYEALIHWGVDNTLERVNGMFAFAVVDIEAKTLTLVRDHIGIKPLYYSITGDQILFGSEVKTFFDLGLMEPALDRAYLGEYLSNCWVYEPDTLFRNVKKLEAGCYLRVDLSDRTFQHRRYWDIMSVPEEAMPDVADAVKLQTISDVPVGAYLSGGVDSSIMACCLKDSDIMFLNLQAGKSESKRVKDLEQLYNLHIERLLPEPDGLELYNGLVRQMDEPIADPAVVPAYLLAKRSRDLGRVVMISGMGGDEIDAGYTRHRILHYHDRIRWLRWVPDFLIRGISRGKRRRDLRRLKAFLDRPVPENYFSLTYYMTRDEVGKLVGPHWYESYERKIREMCSHLSGLKRYFYLDMRGFLASHNLIYMDKASMAASVEVRVPLLDRYVAQSMFAEVDEPQHAGKRRLKAYLQSLLGDGYVELKKEGFTYPVDRWVQEEIQWPEVISFFRERNVLNTEVVESWVNTIPNDIDAVSMKLWTVYTLYVWMREFNVLMEA